MSLYSVNKFVVKQRSPFMQKLMIFILLALFAGCGKSSASPASNQINPPIFGQEIASGTCNITRPGGYLAGDIYGSTVFLYKEYLPTGLIQIIYSEGEFPRSYGTGTLDTSHPKEEILANAKAWQWAIAMARDERGGWTVLRIYKQVLNSKNGVAYETDAKIINFGDQVDFMDMDSGIRIQCSIPNLDG